MNKKSTLLNVLKKSPKGTRLWSIFYGDCELVEVKNSGPYPIRCRTVGEKHNKTFAVNKKAWTYFKPEEHILFK